MIEALNAEIREEKTLDFIEGKARINIINKAKHA
jgi:hypothetical protein